MVDHARDSVFADPDMAVPWLCFGKWLRPIPLRRTVRHARVPSYDPTESRRGGDYMSITVDDASSLLDCSGCRMLMLGSTFEG